jgi:hypothetical protein
LNTKLIIWREFPAILPWKLPPMLDFAKLLTKKTLLLTGILRQICPKTPVFARLNIWGNFSKPSRTGERFFA